MLHELYQLLVLLLLQFEQWKEGGEEKRVTHRPGEGELNDYCPLLLHVARRCSRQMRSEGASGAGD